MFTFIEHSVKPQLQLSANDTASDFRQNVNMPRGAQKSFQHTWFVREWMQRANVTQADLQRLLDWPKSKASYVVNGQRYNQQLIDELAPILHARPFELLLHPEDAYNIRSFRETAVRVAAIREPGSTPPEPPEPQEKTGTKG